MDGILRNDQRIQGFALFDGILVIVLQFVEGDDLVGRRDTDDPIGVVVIGHLHAR